MANSPIPHPTCSNNDVVVEDAVKQQQQQQHQRPTSTSPVNGSVSMAARGSPGSSGAKNKINVGEDDEMTVIGYAPSVCRQFLAMVILICTGGLAGLVFYWKKVRELGVM